MNVEKFSRSAQALIGQAAQFAQSQYHSALSPLHILYAATQDQFCVSFFNVLHVPVVQLQQILQTELSRLPQAQGGSLHASNELTQFVAACEKEAKQLQDEFITLEHVLLVAAMGGNFLPQSVSTFLKQQGFTKDAVLGHMHKVRQGKKVTDQNAESSYQVLEKFCQNITQLARDGKLDPVIGRHEEIRRVIQILSRRTKNNPVLIGDPGVGKTAIVEGIAQRIINNDVPESLQGKQIYSLDLGLLIAGTKYQGEFEERLKNLLKAVQENSDSIILFIDELHMLVGAGSSGGGMDASNLLKPALARGELHAIGATTIKEYKKYIEKDAALERRFQKVLVTEPTVEDAISILRGLKEKYELHHGVKITDGALVQAAQLSAKHIPDRFLPDKAIDLVDEAASMVRMAIDSKPEQLDKLDRKVRQLEIEKVALEKESNEASKKRLQELQQELETLKEQQKTVLNQWEAERRPLEKIKEIKTAIELANYEFEQAERTGDFAKASEIKYGKLVELHNKLAQEQQKLQNIDGAFLKEEVTQDDIAKVLARWTGIPVEKLQASESEKLLSMDAVLEKRVVGQHDAVEKIAQTIQMHRAGLSDPHRPIGSFLFLGPTGVGKTEVAKTLADFLFNDEKYLVRIDMSEYMEKHAVSRLIGSPPGYVGHEEGGQLTELVRKQPYSVILFDEIEKAHPDVFNIFLQILDDGRLTDGQGRTISFVNTIIIMTSNIGSHLILQAKEVTPQVKTEIEKLLHAHFKPEFLNRIDEIVFFNSLSEKVIQQITRNHAQAFVQRLQERGVTLDISDDALVWLAKIGYEPEFGARPLKRALKQYVIVPVSKYLLAHPDAKEIHIKLQNDSLIVN
jgi:ATP-dependent Clp protease ATP-binding subunit ClpB